MYQPEDLTIRKQKCRDKKLELAEQLPTIRHYFDRLQKVISDNGIAEQDIWNMDERGFQIGVGEGQHVGTQKGENPVLLAFLSIPNMTPVLRLFLLLENLVQRLLSSPDVGRVHQSH